MAMRFGELELTTVSGGRLRLDGGTMFGVVPRPLWEKVCPPDEKHRVQMDTNCLLVHAGKHTILIDTGYGSKLDEKARAINAAEEGNPLLRNLAALGVQPGDITMVIFTHLHFDHAGGSTFFDNGMLKPVFPNAKHFVQRTEWDDATGNIPELMGSYFVNDFLPVEEAGLIELIDGDAEILPNIRVRLVGGHTRGQQIVYLGRGDQQAVYLADLCPFPAHLRTFWSMSYDQFPLQQRRMKPIVLGEAADHGWPVLFDHDPTTRAATITRDTKREFVVKDSINL